MLSTAPSPESLDPQTADSLVRAEELRLMLRRLSEVGMALVEEVAARTVNAPLHPEPRHDPGRTFANVSRAVRFSVVLELRLDADILAVRKGEAPPNGLIGRGQTAPRALALGVDPVTPVFAPVSKIPACPMRAKVQGAVWEAINREIGDLETAEGALDRVHEGLVEGEDYDAFLSLPWRECVQAICTDLGLDPDWSDWSDDDGFTPPELGPRYDWPRFWTYDPAEADVRRQRRADRAAPPQPVMAEPGQGPP